MMEETLSDKINDGMFPNWIAVEDVREAVQKAGELAFGWMSGGCDEEYCKECWKKIFGEALAGGEDEN